MPYLTVAADVNLFYRDWGTGNPVVFLHSWSLSSAMWQYEMVRLAEAGMRTVAYDRRGHGRSEQPWGGYDFDTLADDLHAVLEQLDLREVTLVGHSTGTAEIVRYLARHGSERVARIALVSSALPYMTKTEDNPLGQDPESFDALRAMWRNDVPGWIRAVSEPFFGVGLPGNTISQELIDWTVADANSVATNAMLDLSHSVTETDHRDDLRAIAVPTLIVHGADDPFNPLNLCGQLTADLIPGSELKVYENASHGLHLTHMDQLSTDLLEFIKK
ncbi:alpha/beta fold hydrolase [Nocardia sp. NPDC059240]|uniref:alpha/beta fold hydrolase n=1 Tax=Nocardia sp. NPDC059240 TaxID=3346786 RepID=UPI003686F7DC